MLEIKIGIKNIGVQHSLEKNETATMFFLKKPFLVICFILFGLKFKLKFGSFSKKYYSYE